MKVSKASFGLVVRRIRIEMRLLWITTLFLVSQGAPRLLWRHPTPFTLLAL